MLERIVSVVGLDADGATYNAKVFDLITSFLLEKSPTIRGIAMTHKKPQGVDDVFARLIEETIPFHWMIGNEVSYKVITEKLERTKNFLATASEKEKKQEIDTLFHFSQADEEKIKELFAVIKENFESIAQNALKKSDFSLLLKLFAGVLQKYQTDIKYDEIKHNYQIIESYVYNPQNNSEETKNFIAAFERLKKAGLATLIFNEKDKSQNKLSYSDLAIFRYVYTHYLSAVHGALPSLATIKGNPALLTLMHDVAEVSRKCYLTSVSNRQTNKHNHLGRVEHGTPCFYQDIDYIVKYFNGEHPLQSKKTQTHSGAAKFTTDAALFEAIYGKENCFYDRTKFSVLYFKCHKYAAENKDADKINFYFLDDLDLQKTQDCNMSEHLAIHETLIKTIKKNPTSLPKKCHIVFARLNEKGIKIIDEVDGEGEIDENYVNNTRHLCQSCEKKPRDVAIDVAHQVNIAQFLQKRCTMLPYVNNVSTLMCTKAQPQKEENESKAQSQETDGNTPKMPSSLSI